MAGSRKSAQRAAAVRCSMLAVPAFRVPNDGKGTKLFDLDPAFPFAWPGLRVQARSSEQEGKPGRDAKEWGPG